jgi:hypothetical protein
MIGGVSGRAAPLAPACIAPLGATTAGGPITLSGIARTTSALTLSRLFGRPLAGTGGRITACGPLASLIGLLPATLFTLTVARPFFSLCRIGIVFADSAVARLLIAAQITASLARLAAILSGSLGGRRGLTTSISNTATRFIAGRFGRSITVTIGRRFLRLVGRSEPVRLSRPLPILFQITIRRTCLLLTAIAVCLAFCLPRLLLPVLGGTSTGRAMRIGPLSVGSSTG